ncbi:MAG: response regulator [Chloroflexaceae bacterium]|jgi:CheY-like chemotaxis protein|nr:response regulator [Chloroflexaceae bacterium]
MMTTAARILVVDDEAPIADLIADVLGDEGYTVCTVHNGDDALASVSGYQPDLIFLDSFIPGISGDELLLALRNQPNLTQTPIVVMSASADAVALLARHGGTRTLMKPFNLDDLLNCVNSALAPA